MFKFTIFTPTFNRVNILHRVYDSLCNQTFDDFEWLIVDDGSTDDTRQRIEGWQKEADFPIRYYWQENQHKKVALNHGVALARGELFLPVDSDDAIMPDTLEIFLRAWQEIPEGRRHRYSGIVGLCVSPDGTVVGDFFPVSPFDGNLLEMYYRYRIRGEKIGFHRTEVMRQFPFPEDVEGYVPESTVWFAIARAGYLTRFLNEKLRVYHPTPSSITHGPGSSVVNTDGLALIAREALQYDLSWFRYMPREFLMAAARYTRFHLHLARQQPGKRWPLKGVLPKTLVALMWPIGVVFFFRDLLSRR